MTDEQQAEAVQIQRVERAKESPVTQAILQELKPYLRREIWFAAVVCSGIIGACVYLKSRVDMIDLKTDIQKRLEINNSTNITMPPTQHGRGIFEELSEKALLEQQKQKP